MALKAAFFTQVGLDERHSLGFKEFALASREATLLQIANWPNQGRHHKLEPWADLIIGHRSINGNFYQDPAFSAQLERNVELISTVWSETLRYHKNRPYPSEFRNARNAAAWINENSREI